MTSTTETTSPQVTRSVRRAGGRVRATVLLVRPVVRLVPWWHLAVGALVAGMVVIRARGQAYATDASMVSALRLAAIPLALSAGFVLDDPTEETLAGTPLPIAVRRVLRVVFTVLVVAGAWLLLLWLAESAPALSEAAAQREQTGQPALEGWRLPWVAVSIHGAALLALTLAAAALGVRLSADRSGGLVALPVVLAGAVISHLLPPDWTMVLPPGSDPAVWHDAHERWAWLAAAALVLLLHASRDPGRVRLRARVTSTIREGRP